MAVVTVSAASTGPTIMLGGALTVTRMQCCWCTSAASATSNGRCSRRPPGVIRAAGGSGCGHAARGRSAPTADPTRPRMPLDPHSSWEGQSPSTSSSSARTDGAVYCRRLPVLRGVQPVVQSFPARLRFALVGVVAQPSLHVRRHVPLASRPITSGRLVIAVIRIASNTGHRRLMLGAARLEVIDPRLALLENTLALVDARLR